MDTFSRSRKLKDQLKTGRNQSFAYAPTCLLQRRAANYNESPEVPPGVHEVLRSPGQPLDPDVRAFMEPRFGHNFSNVGTLMKATPIPRKYSRQDQCGDELEKEASDAAGKIVRTGETAASQSGTQLDFNHVQVHTGPGAAESTHALSARAYTVGNHIVFGNGEYRPNSYSGRELIAHELAHVAQQQQLPQTFIQCAGFFESIARFFGGGTFSEEELQNYLTFLRDNNRIEDGYDSDNKARAIVQSLRNDSSSFDLTPRIKTLLIQEMQSGFTGDDDEEAILYLLTSADETELGLMFGPGGIDPRALNEDFHGVQRQQLMQFYQQRFEGGLAAVLQNRIRPQPALDTHDSVVVQRARRRLAILERILGEAMAVELERTSSLSRRREMDRTAADLGPPGARAQMEESNLENLNRLPLHISVTGQAVIFRVMFHVRFEDPAMANRFSTLESSLREGINLVWNQRLSGSAFGGRSFLIDPVIRLIGTNDPRDQNYWLITVRRVNTGQVNYPGCVFDPLPASVPTSATMSTCDGGVMSIPPAHIDNPGVLGHELLHLFGLVDRYMLLVSQTAPGGRATGHQTSPTRQTGGRGDPLGGEDATILEEDLAFLFEHLGVYEREIRRVTQGRGTGWLRMEIERMREIIRLGYDPRSLIRPRQDFNRELFRSAEDI